MSMLLPEDLLALLCRNVDELLTKGEAGELTGRTYLHPKRDTKWQKGRSRVTMTFGCAARDGSYSPHVVDELPDQLLPPALLDHVKHNVDACVVEVFEPNQWRPPRADGADFESASTLVCLSGIVRLAMADKIIFGPQGSFVEDQETVLQPGQVLPVSLTPDTKISIAKSDNCMPISDLIRILLMIAMVTYVRRQVIMFLREMNGTTKHRIATEARKLAEKLEKATVLPVELESTAGITTPDVEREHVHKVYNKIASHWSRTRHSPWPRVAEFIQNLPEGSLIADVGCGNGKYIDIVPNRFSIGSDMSSGLIELCRERGNEVFVCDNMAVPLRSNAFDAAISIAVLHHFSTPERRLRALQETVRLVCPGGKFLVYAWALEQGPDSRREFPQQDVLVPWHHQKPEEEKREHETPEHGVVDEKKQTTVYRRYCHMYKEGELAALIEQLGNVRVLETYWDTSNWCVAGEKLNP